LRAKVGAAGSEGAAAGCGDRFGTGTALSVAVGMATSSAGSGSPIFGFLGGEGALLASGVAGGECDVLSLGSGSGRLAEGLGGGWGNGAAGLGGGPGCVATCAGVGAGVGGPSSISKPNPTSSAFASISSLIATPHRVSVFLCSALLRPLRGGP